jgi:CBS domain-containing protein
MQNPLDLSTIGQAIQARHMEVPLSRAYVSAPTARLSDVHHDLISNEFDCCPVLESGVPIGLLAAPAPFRPTDQVSAAMRPLDGKILVSADTPVIEVGKALMEERMLFVVSERQITGFVTPADLGSIAVRTYVYLQLAGLESGLAAYLRRLYPKAKDALALLSDDRQEVQSKLVAELHRQDQYIDELSACSFFDLLSIAGKTDHFREYLPKNRGWGTLKRGLSDFRNDVMHPSRPLTSADSESTRKLVSRIENIEVLASTCHSAWLSLD